MLAVKRDPTFISQQVKRLRKVQGWTQDSLAQEAGVSTRTVEKLESGRHTPEEQTLRSIARALGVDVAFFDKVSPEEEERRKVEAERVLRKNVLVTTRPIRSASDFLAAFDHMEAYRIDMSAVEDEQALELAAAMGDWIRDLGDVWAETYMSQRLEYARSFAQLCEEIEQHGYLCYMGRHRQQLRQKDRSRLIFTVLVMTILPSGDPADERYALVQLEGGWESMEEDRLPLD